MFMDYEGKKLTKSVNTFFFSISKVINCSALINVAQPKKTKQKVHVTLIFAQCFSMKGFNHF